MVSSALPPGRRALWDPEAGRAIDALVVAPRIRRRYDPWTVWPVLTHRLLARLDLPAAAHRILHYLAAHLEVGQDGLLRTTDAEIARYLGVSRRYVGYMITLLEREQLLEREHRGALRLSAWVATRDSMACAQRRRAQTQPPAGLRLVPAQRHPK